MSVKQSELDAVPTVLPLFGKLHHFLDEAARPWNLSPRDARFMFWMPVVATLFIFASCLYRPLFTFLLDEDGLAEWLQFALFCVACVSGCVITIQLARTGRRFYAGLFAFFAVAMFFCAGEEISWGQRVLGIETPEGLAEANKQKEITLHNVGEALTYMRLVMFTGSLIGATAWFVNRKLHVERLIPQADALFIPPPFLTTAFLVMFFYRVVRYAFPSLVGFTVVHLAEWPEFCFAFALAAFSFLIARRLKSEAHAAA